MPDGARGGKACVDTQPFRFVCALILFAFPAFGLSQSITEYAVPSPAPTDLYGMARGPDGAIWFGESHTQKIGRIAADGTITEFPTPGHAPYQLATGSDGNVWFVNGGEVGRMTPSGQLTYFSLPMDSVGLFGTPLDIAAGPDGALWVADGSHRIGRVTVDGIATAFALPEEHQPLGYPYSIAAGPDGNLWFTDGQNEEVGRMTPTGVLTDFPVPTGVRPYDITAGPDGAMWFSTTTGGVGRITTGGNVRMFGSGSLASLQLTAGPDGNVWFTDAGGNVSRITPEGVVTQFPIPTQSGSSFAIATGADGNIWFTENASNKIGRLEPGSIGPPLCVSDTHTLCLNQNRFAVTASFQQAPSGPSVPATAVPLTADTGYFWFFDAANIEIVTKVLNGCATASNAYWVFAAGLTNVGVTLTVMDMQSGVLMRTYENPVGTAFAPIQDTSAFKTCP